VIDARAVTRAAHIAVLLSVSTASLVSGRSAHADGPVSNPPRASDANAIREASTQSAAAPPAEPASVANTERPAQADYEKALEAYAKGDVQGALVAMRESYAISGRPELLYNLARLEREQQHCAAALEDYAQYLQRVPQGRHRDLAQQAIDELAVNCPTSVPEKPTASNDTAEENSARKSAAKSPPRGEAHSSSTARVLGWSAISAGILSAGAALYFDNATRNARNDAQENIDLAKTGAALYDPSRVNDFHRDRVLTVALGVSAGAFVMGGVVALLLDTQAARAEPSVAVVVQPGAVQASYSTHF
jgi:hypothetical protein